MHTKDLGKERRGLYTKLDITLSNFDFLIIMIKNSKLVGINWRQLAILGTSYVCTSATGGIFFLIKIMFLNHFPYSLLLQIPFSLNLTYELGYSCIKQRKEYFLSKNYILLLSFFVFVFAFHGNELKIMFVHMITFIVYILCKACI